MERVDGHHGLRARSFTSGVLRRSGRVVISDNMRIVGGGIEAGERRAVGTDSENR